MTTPVPRSHRGLFAGGVLLGLMAEQVVLFSVPLLIFQDSKELSTLGFAFALEWLPGLIAYPFAGLLADRDGGARLFSRVAAGRAAVLTVVVAVLLLRPSVTTAALMTSGALLSVLVAPVRMSVEKMVPQIAKGEQLAATQALVQNMELLAMALGPALAMLGAVLLGKVWLLGIAAAVFALAGLCWLPLPRVREKRARQNARANLAELKLGWSLLTGNRPVLLLGVLNFAINFALATLLSMNAALVTGVFKAPDSAFALLNTCVGVIGLVNLALIPFLLRKFSVQFLGVLGFTLLAAGLLLVGVTPSFAVYAVLYVAVMTGDALYNIYNRTQRIRVIPQEHLGKIMGPFYLLNLLSFPLAGLLVGSAATAVGPQNLVAALAVVLCVFGAVLLPLTMRSFRRAIAAREGLLVGAKA
ncbi:MFS transporter [Streptomyces xanthochromogenes]|uniref:MFS transporter n=1 Tax=Streptomyces xanthochromogenes TaxID=67384 RepID=A0ABQ2ZQT0_9ACTN|nr:MULTISPECIES: MFS transporter [Streptomyces]MYV92893.1 MFS transporter [Streptomyces sp. SID1034]GGY20065.1 MFS transporter [Streptomyces xanthochromogenes]GHB62059.1 MFS transporter [Streptomyces xanthochromogenes]